ncbi:hypothetical protein MRB53_023627 [Persea americana]|uniref:Uncharacterized protein n=1 Tax=Persea americana TaxID=3435 RepID=A0ACC2LA10_PERAE|nr:hypothetical protein MRB53_023627 [Persea americana]
MWPARGPSRIPVHASTVVRAARCLGLTKNDMAATWAVVRNLPWQLRLEKVKIEVADYLHQQLHHVRCHSTTRRTIAHELVISDPHCGKREEKGRSDPEGRSSVEIVLEI